MAGSVLMQSVESFVGFAVGGSFGGNERLVEEVKAAAYFRFFLAKRDCNGATSIVELGAEITRER